MNKTEKEALTKIGKGAIIILIGFILAKLLALVKTIVLARGLGTSGYGVFSMAFTIITILSIVCLFGLSQGIVHFIAKNEKNKKRVGQAIKHVFSSVLAISVVIAIALFFAKDYLAVFFNMPQLSSVMVLFAASLPFFALFELFIGVFEGFTLMKHRTLLKDILFNVTLILLSLLFLYLGLDLFGASLAFLLSYIIVFAIAFFIIVKRANFLKAEKDHKLRKQIFNFSWPIMLSSFIYYILTKIDIMFLGHFTDPVTVGKYSVASDVSQMLIVLNAVMLPIFFPVISNLFSKGKVMEAGNIFRKITKLLVAFTLPALVIFIVFSSEILRYLFGKDYSGAGVFLVILSFASFFALASGPIGMFLKSMNKPKWVLFNSLVALALNITLNYILIIKIGAIGVAIATLISIFSQNYLGIFEVWFFKKIQPYSLSLIRPVIVSIAIGVAAYYVKGVIAANLYTTILLALAVLIVYGIYLLLDKRLINLGYYLKYVRKINILK